MASSVSFQRGELIFKSKPFVCVLSQKERHKRCDHCFSSGKVRKCTQCKFTAYCNKRCQASAWNHHKFECPRLRVVAPHWPTDSVRLYYNLLLKLQKLNGDKESEVLFGQTRTFSSLVSHKSEIDQDLKRLADFVQLVQFLKLYAGDDFDLPSPADLTIIFGKMVINSMSICDGEMQPVGVGLYLGASALDHSCIPNAVATFRGNEVHIRSLEPIVVDDCSKIPVTISYIDQMAMTTDRLDDLRSQYYFTCQCTMCSDTRQDSKMAACVCSTAACRGAAVEDNGSVVCKDCQKKYPEESQLKKKADHIKLIKNDLESFKLLQANNDYSTILEKCESRLQTTCDVLHLTNLCVVKLKDWAFDACVQLELWDKCLVYGREVMLGFGNFCSKYYSNLAIHQMKLGKILLFVGSLEDARTNLLQARTVLEVTHGRDHPLVEDLDDLLVQCTEHQRGHLQ